MMPVNTDSIVGTDGLTPVYDPDARWCICELNEIWQGASGKKYVPKVGDYVIEKNEYITYIVDSINPVTLIPVLREIKNNISELVKTPELVLFLISRRTGISVTGLIESTIYVMYSFFSIT
jgi:hypothetical protein